MFMDVNHVHICVRAEREHGMAVGEGKEVCGGLLVRTFRWDWRRRVARSPSAEDRVQAELEALVEGFGGEMAEGAVQGGVGRPGDRGREAIVQRLLFGRLFLLGEAEGEVDERPRGPGRLALVQPSRSSPRD